MLIVCTKLCIIATITVNAVATSEYLRRTTTMDTDNRLLIDHGEAMRKLGGIGRTTFYQLINDGEIEQVHIGRRGFITAKSLAAYVDRLSERVSA